jgi:non-heme chloroperoxidase
MRRCRDTWVKVTSWALVAASTMACSRTHAAPGTRVGEVEPATWTSAGVWPRGDVTLLKLAAWRRSDAEWAHWVDPSPHQLRFVTVPRGSPRGVRLEVLDWGGKGPAVVLLAGSGGTAHIYDDLAPQLTDHFRVIGITRRGHGASSHPTDTTTYTLDVMAEDIGAVLDSLGIRQASLIGHSIAGAEITRFAARFPDRVNKLVYLDSAHDFAAMDPLLASNPVQAPPVVLPPRGTHEDTLNAYRLWGKRDLWRFWSDAMEADRVRAADADPIALRMLLDDATKHPKEYRAVRAPALAISAFYTPAIWFPYLDPLQDSVKWGQATRWVINRLRPFLDRGHERFVREMPNGRLIELDSDHYVFIFREEHTIAELRNFLGSPAAR